MIRKIIRIDRDKCNGCGLCAKACHEGAIGMADGKAVLLRDDYCDGLGDCLPVCPTAAITFEEREAAAYDEAAVQQRMAEKAGGKPHPASGGCPGSMARQLQTKDNAEEGTALHQASRLKQWPVQIKLAPVKAPYFEGADLLIAADCSAYAYGAFHEEFLKGRVVLIGCPKLDMTDYAEKLEEILRNNHIRSLTLVRMEVPCCGGLEQAAKTVLQKSGKNIPLEVVTLSISGEILRPAR